MPCHRATFCKIQLIENIVVLLLSHASDPLMHHGRHFGRSIHAMCNIQALITNGILTMGGDTDEELLTAE
jgi:hypothetical protein